jgi:hypothetical protein
MHFYIYLYICTCTHHVCIYAYLSIYMLEYVYIHMCSYPSSVSGRVLSTKILTYIFIHIHIYLYTCTYIYTALCVHTPHRSPVGSSALRYSYVHFCIHVCIRTYIFTYICTYIWTYVYT